MLLKILPMLYTIGASRFPTTNHILNVSIMSFVVTQLLKVILETVIYGKFSLKRILGGGGMPSSHAACVCGLSAATLKTEGFGSPMFAIATTIAFIVMYDAANVRHAAGEQAKILNYMIKHWKETTPEIFGRELKELIGHTPFQVIVGAALGICIGVVM